MILKKVWISNPSTRKLVKESSKVFKERRSAKPFKDFRWTYNCIIYKTISLTQPRKPTLLR